MSEPNCVNGKCLIPGGTFMMGSPEGVGDPDEHPQREVTMSSFWIGQTEASIGEWKKYVYSEFQKAVDRFDLGRIAQIATTVTEMNKGYCGKMNGKGDEYPVTCLTMKEKDDYCKAQGGRLMTAAEFHYAARNDEQDARADQLVIWDNRGKYGGSTAPVTSGYKNRDGVYNLFGNVWESLADAYERDFYARMTGTDPYNPLTNPYDYQTNPQGQLEEFGGFSFHNNAWYARAANRRFDNPDYRYGNVGFRCARPQDSK